ncbi:MAG: DUF4062 domain-containing protein [Jatrophihabitantaceae bacterium]
MQRLYTAFVSSTYRDLVPERKLLANALLNDMCVPLGMEFFPSTGQNQWRSILESIAMADFCIFIVAGSYGTIETATGISWTQREFRECVSQSKPMVALLSSDAYPLAEGYGELDPARKSALADFRKEIEATTGCRYFSDHAELLTGLYASIGALRRAEMIEGWIPAGKRPVSVQESDFDRTYETVESHAVLVAPPVNSIACDVRYRTRRVMRANLQEGIQRLAIDFSRESETILPFTEANHPLLRLESWERTGPGSARLAPPRRITGAAFVQDVEFTPVLARNECVDISITAVLPEYKYAFAEDLLRATENSTMGARSFEILSRNIIYPTNLLSMELFLPTSLGASPAGPKIGRSSRIDDAETSEVVAAHQYSEREGEVDGVTGIFMRMDVPHPRINRTYRLAWNLPRRGRHSGADRAADEER